MSYKLTASKRRELLKQKAILEELIKNSQKTMRTLRKKKDDRTAVAILGALESAILYAKSQIKWVDDWVASDAKSKKRS